MCMQEGTDKYSYNIMYCFNQIIRSNRNYCEIKKCFIKLQKYYGIDIDCLQFIVKSVNYLNFQISMTACTDAFST